MRWRTGWLTNRAIVLIVLACLGLCAYLVQVEREYTAQQAQAEHHASADSASVMIGWRQPNKVQLHGVRIAGGASGTLRFGGYDPVAFLSIYDLPVLPPSKVYQLWCYDVLGGVDASSTFSIALDDQEPQLFHVVAPRLFGTYSHFAITIETAPVGRTPSDQLVLTN